MPTLFFPSLWLLLFSCGMAYANEMQTSETIKKEIQMAEEYRTPQFLYKIVSNEAYQESLLKKQVVTSPLDQEFIHLATEEQLSHVAKKFWHGRNYMVLKLDPQKMSGRLIYESNPGGSTRYYHLYDGKIPLDAVVEISMVDNE